MCCVCVCMQPLPGDPVCRALISLIHQQHMGRGTEERGERVVGERGGREGRVDRGEYLFPLPFVTPPPQLIHTHTSILALGGVSSWPDHCKTHREEETVSKMATCAVGGQLNHLQEDTAFKQ